MSWQIEFTKVAANEIKTLDHTTQLKIKTEIQNKLMLNPDRYAVPLIGDLSGFFKLKIEELANYRILCKKDKAKLIITTFGIKHHHEV